MSLDSHFGSFNTGTGVAGSTVTISGLGFTPRAILFWWSGRTEAADTVGRANSQNGFGVAVTPTDRRAVTNSSIDAQATTDTQRAHSDVACILSVSAAEAIDGSMDLQSIDLDGFTLIVDDAFPINLRVHYLALGGDSLEAAASGQFQQPGVIGNQDVTVGWQPDCVILFSYWFTSAPPQAQTTASFILGAAVSQTQQAVIESFSLNGLGSTDSSSYCRMGECVAGATVSSTMAGRASFDSFLTDGFRLNWSEVAGGSRYIHYLALRGGDYALGKLQTQTNTVIPIIVDTLDFKLSSALFVSHNMAENAADTPNDNYRLSIGAFSGGARGAQSVLDRDGVPDSEVTTAIEFDAVYANIATDSTIQGLMDIQDINDDGFTTIMDDADPSQAFVWFLAFGPKAPAPPEPFSGEPTPSPNYKLDCFTPNGWRILKPIETTNYVLNPSAETTGNFAALGAATITRSTDFQKYGLYSYRIQSAGSGQGLSLTLSTLTNSVHWMTARIRKTISPPEILFSIGPASHRAMLLEKIDDHWDLYGVMFSATNCNGQTSARISQYGVGAGDFYVDGIQIEPLSDWTTYVDGTQDGCGWNGAEHASTSTRSGQSPDGGTPKDLFTEYKFFVQRVIGAGAATQELTVDSYALLPGGELNSIKVQSRQFTLIGKFICDTEQELHDNQQDLHKLLKRLRTVKLQFNGARAQKEITVVYQGGLEGDLASFYKTFEASGESDWVENFKFIEKANIQFLAPDPFWYEVGESAALLDTNDSDTFRVVAGRLRSTGQWDNLGPPGAGGTYDRVEAIAEDDVYIYFGGNFTNFDGIANADYIVRYHKEDGIYSALSTGMDLTVRSLVVGPDGTLYAGGQFTTSGGVATNGIASWNGSAWSALGSGAVGNVLALDFGPDGLLYAGGDFNSMGGVGGTSKIAKWDGSNWFALGSGMNSDVRSIAFGLNGILYAGGFFTTAGGTAANRIASWNGSAWSALGSGLNNNVEAVAVNKTTGTLYVSGSFTTAGGNSANYIASWNGSAWSALGSGLNANSYSLMVSEDGILYAGGFFTTAGGITLADRVARWNGYAWTHLDIDFPGSPIIYAILTGRHTDPVVKQKYNLYLGFDTTGTGSFAGLVTVENEGNVPAFPKIIFERSVTGLPATIQTVQNETTGKILLADYSLLVGERLTVDLTPTKKSVVSNFFGEVPSAILANSDFGTWRLEPDSQNISCFVNTGGALYGDSAVTHLLWRDKFDSYD